MALLRHLPEAVEVGRGVTISVLEVPCDHKVDSVVVEGCGPLDCLDALAGAAAGRVPIDANEVF